MTYCPKFDKILQIRSSNKKAVQQGISQEKEKKFIIWKSNTIVHPVDKTENIFDEFYIFQHRYTYAQP